MEIPAETPEPAAAVPRKGAEWRRLERAMRRMDSYARSAPTPGDDKRHAHGDGTPPRVLIVDDDAATRLLYSINLEVEGLLVLEAADGRHGLAQARLENPDLVLTDVTMPGLDGFQLADALRRDERTCQIPFVFLSGETAAGNEARARALGALAYLTKPFDVRALALLVAGMLARSNPRTRPAAPQRALEL
jgi:two-component system chemotaxis response regulator CheY